MSVAIFAALGAWGGTIYVATETAVPAGSDETGDGSAERPYLTIAKAYAEAADSGDEIRVAEGEYPFSAMIEVKKAVTIVGAGQDKTIFSPTKTGFLAFTLNNDGAVLRNVCLKGFTCTPNDGAGGAISVKKGKLLDSRVTKCNGSGLRTQGCASCEGDTAEIAGCRFDGNEGRRGCAVFISKGVVRNCLIYGNSCVKADNSTWGGGGLYAGGGVVSNCTVVGNYHAQHGGGVFVNAANARIVKCVFADNESTPNETGTGNDEWYVSNAAYVSAFEDCLFSDAETPNDTCIRANPMFRDPEARDYRIPACSPAAGMGCDLCGSVDACDFDVSPRKGIVGAYACTPSVTGLPDGTSLSYRWIFSRLPSGDFAVTNESTAAVSVDIPKPGRYTVTFEAVRGDTSETLRSVRADMLYVAPATNYVAGWTAENAARSAWPWDSADNASTNLFEVYGAAVDGSTIVMLPGDHYLTNQLPLVKNVLIAGTDRDTVVLHQKGKFRVFVFDCAGAVVSNLTVSGVNVNLGNDQNGKAIWFYPFKAAGYASDLGAKTGHGGKGGVLTGCRVTGCKSMGLRWNGTVAVDAANARVTRCLIDSNTGSSGSGDLGTALKVSSGQVDSCLVLNNAQTGTTDANKGGGGCYTTGGRVYNCTFLGNKHSASCGGLWVAGANADVRNCIFKGNMKGSAGNYVTQNTRFSSDDYTNCVKNCLFADDDPVGPDAISADPGFFDEEAGDYRTTASSPGTNHGLGWTGDAASRDYAGLKRVSGAAIDIGCYEVDEDSFSCMPSVQPQKALAGDLVTFSAGVTGVGEGVELTYVWEFDDGRGHVVRSSSAAPSFPIADPGTYSIRVSVTRGDTGVTVSAVRADALYLVARTNYVVEATAENAARAAYPWDTRDNASTNVLEVYEQTIDGSTIVLCGGTHAFANQVKVEKAVTIAGDGVGSTFVTPKGSFAGRAFELENEGAVVRTLTITNFNNTSAGNDGDGYAFRIGTNGGTLEDCHVVGNRSNCLRCQGAVSVRGARAYVQRCLIASNCERTSNGNEGGPGCGLAITAGFVDSCLVVSNWSNGYRGNGGGVYLTGGQVRNCTFVGNFAISAGGGAYIGANKPGSVINCIFAGNRTGKPSSASPVPDEWAVSSAVQTNAFVRCLFRDEAGAGADPLTGDPLFADAAHGDYRVGYHSPCYKVGVYDPWMDAATDLDGNPRVRHYRRSGIGQVDLGCYESAWVPNGLILLVR